MLNICSKNIPIEICDKIQHYKTELYCGDKKKRFLYVFHDIKKVTKYMNFYNNYEPLQFYGVYKKHNIKWLCQYLDVSKQLYW